MREIADLICQVGFPIFVALYFMIVLDKRMKGLEAAIRELTSAIKRKE